MIANDTPPRPQQEAIDALQRHALATVSSGLEPRVLRARVLDGHALHRVSGSGVVAGPVVTAWNVWGSTPLTTALFEMLQPGDVVVVGGDTLRALWGDNATRRALRCAAAGAIVDGNVRDVDAIATTGFSVWATRIFVGEGPRTGGPGAINVPITVRGATVEPGDVVVADGDGIGFIPRALLDGVIAKADKRAEEDRRVAQEIQR